MAVVRHLGIVLPPYETTHKVCCWPQRPVKFHVNVIAYGSEDIAMWIFRIFGLKYLVRPPKWGFWRLWTPKCDYSSSRPPKGTSLRKSAFFKLSTAKIRWGIWRVDSKCDGHTHTHTHTPTHTRRWIYILSMHSIGRTMISLLCYYPLKSMQQFSILVGQ